MKFELLTGHAFSATCCACHKHQMAGSEPVLSASTGKPIQPDKVYIEPETFEKSPTYYCESCAAKLSGAEDPTRSRSNYYEDTAGQVVAE